MVCNIDVVDSGVGKASDHMGFDADIIIGGNGDNVVIHFYRWRRPSITWGCLIDVDKYVDRISAGEIFDMSSRPTGGGISFHQDSFAFSIFVPNRSKMFSRDIVSNYKLINTLLLKVLFKLNPAIGLCQNSLTNGVASKFCSSHLNIYDIVIGDRKVCGGAQRIYRRGFLHQGNVLISNNERDIVENLGALCVVKEASNLGDFTTALLQNGFSEEVYDYLRNEFLDIFFNFFRRH